MINPKRKLVMCGAAISVLGFALYFAEYEITSPAQGFVNGDENNISIKSPSVGNVSKIYVSSGSPVEVGTPLIAFDNQDLIFRVKSLEKNAGTLKDNQSTSSAEICFLSHLLETLEGEDKTDQEDALRVCGFDELNDSLGLGIVNSFAWKVSDYFSYKDSIKLLIDSKDIESGILDESYGILEKKIERLKKHNAIKLQIGDTLRELNSLSQRKNEFKSEKIRLDIDISNKKNMIYSEIATRLALTTEAVKSIDSDLALTLYELELSNLKIARSTIHSPIKGVVLNLEENVGVDYFLEESESIMLLKKDNSNIVINARFETKYRSNISMGMKVRVQPNLASSKGTIEGHIAHISEDSFKDEKKDGDHRYYEVKIIPDDGSPLLEEGTEVTVFAVGWTVNLLDYIKSVFIKNKVKFEPYT